MEQQNQADYSILVGEDKRNSYALLEHYLIKEGPSVKAGPVGLQRAANCTLPPDAKRILRPLPTDKTRP